MFFIEIALIETRNLNCMYLIRECVGSFNSHTLELKEHCANTLTTYLPTRGILMDALTIVS